MDAILALLLTLYMPPDVADAYVENLIFAETPIPDTFPLGTGHAIERFWKRHELWSSPVDQSNWNDARIAAEIRWCRNALDCNPDLPPMAELFFLPPKELAEAGLTLCDARMCELNAMREYALVRDPIDAAIGQVERLRWYWIDVRVARDERCSILCRREAIKHARQLVGDPAWFGGWPVPICP